MVAFNVEVGVDAGVGAVLAGEHVVVEHVHLAEADQRQAREDVLEPVVAVGDVAVVVVAVALAHQRGLVVVVEVAPGDGDVAGIVLAVHQSVVAIHVDHLAGVLVEELAVVDPDVAGEALGHRDRGVVGLHPDAVGVREGLGGAVHPGHHLVLVGARDGDVLHCELDVADDDVRLRLDDQADAVEEGTGSDAHQRLVGTGLEDVTIGGSDAAGRHDVADRIHVDGDPRIELLGDADHVRSGPVFQVGLEFGVGRGSDHLAALAAGGAAVGGGKSHHGKVGGCGKRTDRQKQDR